MADKKFDLVFNASLEVGQIKTAIASLTKSLENAGAKIPQSMTTNLNRMIQSLSTELNKLESMTDIQLDSKNAKNIGKSYEKILQTFQQIKTTLSDINHTAGIDPEKFFPSEIASNISKATQAVQKYRKAAQDGLKTDEYTKSIKDITEAEKKVKNLNDKLDEATRKRQSSSIVKNQLQEARKKLQTEKNQAEIEGRAAREAQKVIQDKIKFQEKLTQIEEDINKKKKKQQEAVNKAAKANEIKNEREGMKEAKGKGVDTKIYRDAVASYVESTSEVKKLQNEINQLESEYAQLSQAATVTADEITAANERATKASTELTNAQKRLNKNQSEIDAADTKYTTATAEVKTLVPEIQKAEDALKQLIQKKEQMETSFKSSIFDELIQELEKLGIKLPDTERNMEGIERIFKNITAEAKTKVVQAFDEVETATKDVNNALKQTGQVVDNFNALGEEASRAEQEMENLKNQVLDFFSISNTIQIFKNAVRDAFETVKELDAAMTETAVVTDFSVGDMWDKLPEYSEQATQLGTSIKSLYEATTLYYQQGLKSEAAMSIGIETMKMARIANMDATQATEAMTAALRGFNMEINETSAARINDVYSELAAITASDTEQIATAMSKTASIAASANMEFETTAALLAQIIETTQEAPETAGTAMKTIIARFTEVKELFSEGMLTGEDSEGEEININKIDAALKSVGISLKDFLNGKKGIDDIFLELASKWDSLDLATQHYIATTAAGSRQQSRFIAMMSNYERTMELVTAANDSAGASQKQFDKTLESLDAKLMRLSDAWKEFTMGLANHELIKAGVDLLTKLLEVINKLTGLGGSEGLGGLSTTFLRFLTIIGGLKIGSAALNGFFASFSQGGQEISGVGKIISKFFPQIINAQEELGKVTSIVDLFKKFSGGFKGSLEEVLKQTTSWKNFTIKSFTDVGKAISNFGGKTTGALGGLTKVFGGATTGAKALLLGLGKIAIVVGAVWLLVKAFKALISLTPEGKLKAAQEATQKATEAAREAAEAYDNLNNSLKSIEDETSTLSQLTKGTREWEEAVNSLNTKILELINLYPELAAFLETSSDGVLSLNTKKEINRNGQKITVSSILKDYSNEAIKTQAIETTSKLSEIEASEDVLYKEYSKRVGGISNLPMNADYTTTEVFKELAKALAKGQVEYDKNGEAKYQSWINKNYSGTYIKDIDWRELLSYGQELINNEEIKNGLKEAVTNASLDLVELGQSTQLLQNLDKDIINFQYDQKYNELKSKYGEEKANELLPQELANAYKEISLELNNKNTELISEVLGNEGGSLTKANLTKYGQYTEEGFKLDSSSAEQIAIDAGFNNLQDMAETFNMNVEDFTEVLAQNFETAGNRMIKQRVDLVKNMSKLSKGKEKDLELNANLLAFFEAKYKDFDMTSMLTEVIDKLGSIDDEALASSAYEQLRKTMMETQGAAAMQDAFDFFNQINFNDPIEALDTINKEIKQGTGSSKELAIAMKESNNSFLGLQSQFTSLANSETFVDIKEDLDEIIEKNGQISAMDVNNLAKSYKSLDKILKNNEVSAAGLAEVFEKIQSGDLSVDNLTEPILAAASSIKTLDSVIAKTILEIENFDLGINENIVGETVIEWGQLIQDNLKKGAVGNSQNFRILDYLFPGWSKDLSGDELVKEQSRLSKKLVGNGKDLRNMWKDLSENKDFQGNEISLSGENSALGIEVNKTSKGYDFTGWEGKGLTSEDLVSWIADAYNTSKELASMMLVDFKNASIDLAEELRKNDLVAGVEKVYESLDTYGNQKVIDKTEIKAIAELLEIDEDEATNKLAEKARAEGRQLTITEFYNEDGSIKSFKEIQAFMDELTSSGKESGSKWSDSFMSSVEMGNTGKIENLLDMDDLEKQLSQIGIKGKAAETLKRQAFESFKQGITEGANSGFSGIETILSNGEEVTIPITPEMDYEAYQQQIENLEQSAKNEALASAIATAMGNVTLNTTVDENSIAIFKEQIETTAKEADTTIAPKADEVSIAGITSAINNAIEQADKEVALVVSSDPVSNAIAQGISKSGKTVKLKASMSPVTLSFSGAASGIIKIEAHKKGIINSPHDHDALVSEEGPELIQTEDGAYLTGLNGPEIAHINKGDTVYTAKQTKQILKTRSNKVMPRHVEGYGYGNSGGKTSKEEDKWENPFDKLYNLIREIDEELRQRERIERRYEKLLENINISASKIIKVSQQELEQLNKEQLLQKQLIEGRQYQIDKYQKENTDLNKYAKVAQNERGEDILRIDWDLINSVSDEKQGEKIQNYVEQLEEWFDELQGAEDALWEIEDTIQEIKERGKDEYFDLENAIKDAIINERTQEIEKLTEINNSIEETNSNLIDSIQKSLDRQRQERDNQRTEQELADKQRRLSYLQQDTSGANDLEIKRLQKEIEEGSLDYTDSLIDQKINQLSEQNDEAAKQRQQQIDIAQQQLDHYIETGAIWQDVYTLMNQGLNGEDGLIKGSKLENILQNEANFSGLSKIGQLNWWKDFNNMVAQSLSWLRIGAVNSLFGEGSKINFTDKDGNLVSGIMDSNGNIKTSDGLIYRGSSLSLTSDNQIFSNESGIREEEDFEEKPEKEQGTISGEKPEEAPEETQQPDWPKDLVKPSQLPQQITIHDGMGYNDRHGPKVKSVQTALTYLGYDIGQGGINGKFSPDTVEAVKQFQIDAKAAGYYDDAIDGRVGPRTKKAFAHYGYKTGGLADFTGPAWLDGTKAKPEYVLNSTQTEGFLKLVDILSGLKSNYSFANQSQKFEGDTFDIDINIETVKEEADIDMLTEKIQKSIITVSKYRNNNFVVR